MEDLNNLQTCNELIKETEVEKTEQEVYGMEYRRKLFERAAREGRKIYIDLTYFQQ
jgi:hypothetical protein